MSAQRIVSSASRPIRPLARFTLALAALFAAFAAGMRFGACETIFAEAPGGNRVAFVTDRTCIGGRCQTLWIGQARRDAEKVATLEAGAERCDEIAWTKDGRRVGFLVGGYQLRVYDAQTLAAAGQVNLLQPRGRPSARIARGVTFSDNGKAVTFDECPRSQSGCRAGIVAVPQ
jgi:hypothetical protein